MALTGVIGSFQTNTYDVKRKTTGTTVAGRYTAAAETTLSAVVMSIQPVNGTDIQALPEGQHSENTRKVYTNTELFTRTPTNDPDEIVIDSERWVVITVERWEAFGDVHYKAFAARNVTP